MKFLRKKFTHQPPIGMNGEWDKNGCNRAMRKKKLNPKLGKSRWKLAFCSKPVENTAQNRKKRLPSRISLKGPERKKYVSDKINTKSNWYGIKTLLLKLWRILVTFDPSRRRVGCSHRTCNKRCFRFHLPPYYFKARFQFAARGVLCWSGIWNLWKFLPQNNETMRVWNSISPLFRPQNFSLSDGLFLTYLFSAFLFLFDTSHSCLGISRLIANQKKK